MLKLERFSEDDFDNLISWIASKEELIQFAGPIFEFPLSQKQLQKYISDPNVIAYKVIYANDHIGHAEINLTERYLPKLCRILIGNINYRGKGLGLQLVELLLQICKEEFGANKAELNVYDWNEKAIKCYERAGFQFNREKQREIIVDGKKWISLNMVKRI
jgi:RimJ/RimL family protein N-acetyltransferase